MINEQVIRSSLEDLSKQAHTIGVTQNLWSAEDRLVELVSKQGFSEDVKFLRSAIRGLHISMVHGELSEAIEGDRRNLMDSKLPEFSAFEMELADAVLRIMNINAREGLRVPEAILAKLKLNATRTNESEGKNY